jgi:hypothetical protein
MRIHGVVSQKALIIKCEEDTTGKAEEKKPES